MTIVLYLLTMFLGSFFGGLVAVTQLAPLFEELYVEKISFERIKEKIKEEEKNGQGTCK